MAESETLLHKAIAAAKADKWPEAKVILERSLEEDPEDANAWFLYSALADTEDEQIQRLNRVLAIQPEHQGARTRLARLGQLPANSSRPQQG